MYTVVVAGSPVHALVGGMVLELMISRCQCHAGCAHLGRVLLPELVNSRRNLVLIHTHAYCSALSSHHSVVVALVSDQSVQAHILCVKRVS